MKLVCPDDVEKLYGNYLKNVIEKFDEYEDICKELRAMPEFLKELGLS